MTRAGNNGGKRKGAGRHPGSKNRAIDNISNIDNNSIDLIVSPTSIDIDISNNIDKDY